MTGAATPEATAENTPVATTPEVTPAPTAELRAWREGAVGRIRLERPKALNSLTLAMVRAFEAALDDLEADPAVRAILVDGAGERGFCAGGDIRAVADSGRRGDGLAATFWREEYLLNARISHLAKPYVVLMDGIVMGGGVGLAVHGRIRVVTERTRLAMPEVGIGFVPDVGGTFALARTPGELGTWMALTGEAIGAADAVYAGLADHVVASDRLPALGEALAALGPDAGPDEVAAAVAGFAVAPDATGPLQQHRALIDRTMAAGEVEAILTALGRAGGEFATTSAATIAGRSPTSLKVALKLLRLARGADLETCLTREFRAACRTLAGADFYEGVRAAVIDKDRRPQWSPKRLDEVGEAIVAAHMEPVDGEPVFPAPAAKPG